MRLGGKAEAMDTTDESPHEDCDFESLLARVRHGDETAAVTLVRRYERAVLRSVRGRMGKSMRGTLDSMDIVQSVHRSLLVGLKLEKYDLSTPQQLIGLAVVIVQRKIARQWRRIKRMPRTQERSLDESQGMLIERMESGEPTPPHVVMADETLDAMLRDLDDLDRKLVQLKLKGNSSVESAKELNRSPAFVRMRWSRLRKLLQERGATDAS